MAIKQRTDEELKEQVIDFLDNLSEKWEIKEETKNRVLDTLITENNFSNIDTFSKDIQKILDEYKEGVSAIDLNKQYIDFLRRERREKYEHIRDKEQRWTEIGKKFLKLCWLGTLCIDTKLVDMWKNMLREELFLDYKEYKELEKAISKINESKISILLRDEEIEKLIYNTLKDFSNNEKLMFISMYLDQSILEREDIDNKDYLKNVLQKMFSTFRDKIKLIKKHNLDGPEYANCRLLFSEINQKILEKFIDIAKGQWIQEKELFSKYKDVIKNNMSEKEMINLIDISEKTNIFFDDLMKLSRLYVDEKWKDAIVIFIKKWVDVDDIVKMRQANHDFLDEKFSKNALRLIEKWVSIDNLIKFNPGRMNLAIELFKRNISIEDNIQITGNYLFYQEWSYQQTLIEFMDKGMNNGSEIIKMLNEEPWIFREYNKERVINLLDEHVWCNDIINFVEDWVPLSELDKNKKEIVIKLIKKWISRWQAIHLLIISGCLDEGFKDILFILVDRGVWIDDIISIRKNCLDTTEEDYREIKESIMKFIDNNIPIQDILKIQKAGFLWKSFPELILSLLAKNIWIDDIIEFLCKGYVSGDDDIDMVNKKIKELVICILDKGVSFKDITTLYSYGRINNLIPILLDRGKWINEIIEFWKNIRNNFISNPEIEQSFPMLWKKWITLNHSIALSKINYEINTKELDINSVKNLLYWNQTRKYRDNFLRLLQKEDKWDVISNENIESFKKVWRLITEHALQGILDSKVFDNDIQWLREFLSEADMHTLRFFWRAMEWILVLFSWSSKEELIEIMRRIKGLRELYWWHNKKYSNDYDGWITNDRIKIIWCLLSSEDKEKKIEYLLKLENILSKSNTDLLKNIVDILKEVKNTDKKIEYLLEFNYILDNDNYYKYYYNMTKIIQLLKNMQDSDKKIEYLLEFKRILQNSIPSHTEEIINIFKDRKNIDQKEDKIGMMITYMNILLLNQNYSQEKIRELLQKEKQPIIQYLCYEKLLQHQNVVWNDLEILMELLDNEKNKLKIESAWRKVYEMIIETIIIVDPELKDLFHNEKKLWGETKRRVVENIAEYIKEIAKNWTKEVVNEQIRNKLREVAKIYQSSDSSPADKICLFIDQFNPLSCQCPDLAEKLKDIESDKKKKEAYKIIREDTKDILERSGNNDMLNFLKRTGETDKYNEIIELLREADQKNRENYNKFVANPGTLLEEWDMTHGTNFVDRLSYILASWNLAGELLKENRKADCTPFGIDIMQISIIPSENKNTDIQKTIESQQNRSYWGSWLFFLYKKDVADKYKDKNRLYPPTWNHFLIRTWIPTTEISAIIITQTTDFEMKKETVRKAIATRGMFIPVFDVYWTALLTPEEFDEMKVFYYQLSKKWYDIDVIDSTYKYYLEYKNKQENKQGVVVNKAFQYFKEHTDTEQSDDFVIIISFLKNNDLNTHPLKRYQDPENTFQKMLKVIKKNIFSRVLLKTRNTFFEYSTDFDHAKRLSLKEWMELTKKIKFQPHGFIDNFIENQLQYIDQDTYTQQQKEAKEELKRLLFFDSTNEGNVDVEYIHQISEYFTRKKKELMTKLRENVRKQPYENKDPRRIRLYQEVLIPVITGSWWRWEITLGSDLDYALFVDDEHLPPEITDKETFIKELSDFVNNDLSNNINKILTENGIRADAGLGKKDRRPFSLISTIKSMKINLQENRQEEEPTEIIVNTPLFDQHKGIISQIKEDLIVHSPDRNILDSFISRDLEIGWNKKSFVDSFLEIQKKLVSWEAKEDEMIGYIKEGLQRVICFKFAYLLFIAFEQWNIDHSKAKEIPSDTIWLIDFLYDNKIIGAHEMQISKELWALTYKLRFIGEVFSPQWKEKEQVLKVKNISLKIDEISYNERKRLIELIQEFRVHMLYK